MNIQPTERRSASRLSPHGIGFDAATVRHGLAVQHQLNTASAVEYLKAKDVDAAVINRVLSRQAIRSEDRLHLGLPREAPQTGRAFAAPGPAAHAPGVALEASSNGESGN